MNGGDSDLALTASLRRRMAVELGTLAVLTPVFLYFIPHNIGLYVALALLFFGFIVVSTARTREYVWGRQTLSRSERLRRSAGVMSLVTIPVALAFFVWCLWTGHRVSYVNMFFAFCLYVPWALLQQTIFQVYLLGRLRAMLPLASPVILAALNGTAYGLVHLPDRELALLTIAAGIVWSYSYLRDRHLLPIAISHALLASTFFYFVDARDLFAELLRRLGAL
jgi:membrane protease YdiL (CAAX protease family)